MNDKQNHEEICCPPFDPVLWDDKVFEWSNKQFIRDNIYTFFYIPLNFGKVIKRIVKKVEAADGVMPDSLCLSDHTSKWNMGIYLAVDREIPGAKNETLSGKFYCKVYEGPFGDTGKWGKDFETITKARGFEIKKLFMWYTTCPKCAKKYGKNYVAFLARI